MQKSIGIFTFDSGVPEVIKAIVKDNAIAAKMTAGWEVDKFLKMNFEELLNTYSNHADSYEIGWYNKELHIHFYKGKEQVQFGRLRKVLPKGMEFYQKHVCKDMFLGKIIDVLYENKEYTTRFSEDKRNADSKTKSYSSKKRTVSGSDGEVL